MTCPHISVIIPAYNYDQFISASIDSVVSQLGKKDELLIVDDGSTDNTADVVAAIVASCQHDNVFYFLKGNGGAASARNFGVSKAHHDFVVLLDADDLMLPGALEAFRSAVGDSVDLVIGGHESKRVSGSSHQSPPSPLGATREESFRWFLNKKIRLSHGRFLARKELLIRSPYPESIKCMEDQSVFSHLLALGRSVNIEDMVVQINHHEGSLRNNSSALLESGVKVVDAVFDDKVLPEGLFKYRKGFYVNRCLAVFRRLAKNGENKEALNYYRKAMGADCLMALRFKYLKRAVASSFSLLFFCKGR